MFKLQHISVKGILIVISILVILIYFYNTASGTHVDKRLRMLDQNGDGYVSRQELKNYLTMIRNEGKTRKVDINNIKKQIISGLSRGFLMGLILSDFEGGIALGLVLGAINPLLHTASNSIF